MALVTCHGSRVTSHMSHVICHNFFCFVFWQSGEAYRWRVCYQGGLPRLVYEEDVFSKYFSFATLGCYGAKVLKFLWWVILGGFLAKDEQNCPLLILRIPCDEKYVLQSGIALFVKYFLHYNIADLERTNSMTRRSSTFFFFYFPQILVHFPANFWSLNVQIRNNFKNVILIACKWCKICKNYLYSMVISLSPVKREKNNAFGLNIWFVLFCCDLKFAVIYAFFCFFPPPNLYSQNFRVHKKNPAYGRQSISRPMQIVAPISQ